MAETPEKPDKPAEKKSAPWKRRKSADPMVRSDGVHADNLHPLLLRQDGTPLTAGVLFDQRMRREGRYDKLRETYQAYQKGGLPYAQAIRKARRDMGYTKPSIEFAFADDWVIEHDKRAGSHRVSEVEKQRKSDSVVQYRYDRYEAALRKLPDEAPDSRVMNWIAAHPRLTEWLRMSDEDQKKKVDLKPKDIKDAPCKSAANMLMYAANHPTKFFDKLFQQKLNATKATKRSSNQTNVSGGMEVEDDDGGGEVTVEDFKSILAEIKKVSQQESAGG